jgi:hypothetical protein
MYPVSPHSQLVFFASLFHALYYAVGFAMMGFAITGGRGGSRRRNQRRAPNKSSTILTGAQELSLLITPTPSGSTLTAKHDLIPTFESGSRLSRAAVQFSQYNIISSVVTYEPHCTTTTSGRMAMAWTFDPLESAPVSVRQIL